MSKAKNGDTVRVHYTGKLENGIVVETSKNSDPLQFKIGEGEVILGLEEAVVGMEEGEEKTAKISSAKGYGPHKKEMVAKVEKSRFPDHINPEIGQRLKVIQPDGTATRVTVTDVTESKITLDANHPLAGKDLVFDIRLIEVV
ncbi:MAG: peptidylprolyl isomerase [Spirochaetes bacterium DG_61]|nr:MAG: peptidylprolyl isomerase [Spirochaetes bacterium DG_61]